MKTKNIVIGLSLLAVGTAIVLFVINKNQKEEEPKGEGEVTADSKKNIKITFTR